MLGETFALASALAWAVSGTMLKMASSRFGAMYIVAARAVASLLTALAVAAAFGVADSLGTLTVIVVLSLVASGLAAIVGHLAFVKALSIAQLSLVFPATNALYIMFSIAATIMISGETVAWSTVAGGVLVLGGIYLLSVRREQDAARRADEGPKLLALALCVATGLAWATSVLVQDDAVKATSPVLANAVRTMAMVAIGLTMVGIGSNRRLPQGSGRDHMMIFGSGLVNGVSALLFISSLKFAPPATVVVLTSTSPLFAVTMAFLFLHERMTRKGVLGTAASFTGIALTVW